MLQFSDKQVKVATNAGTWRVFYFPEVVTHASLVGDSKLCVMTKNYVFDIDLKTGFAKRYANR